MEILSEINEIPIAMMLRTSLGRFVTLVRAPLSRHCSDIRNIPTYKPDALDKKILVHFKYYPSFEDVPQRVNQHIMNKVRKDILCEIKL